MIFFDLKYLILLFAASAVMWLFVPERYRTRFLFAVGFTGVAFLQPVFAGILLALVLFVHASGRFLAARPRAGYLFLTITFSTAIWLSLKYGELLLRPIYGKDSSISKNYIVPLGISYLAFKLIAYLVDSYRGIIKDGKLSELLALSFFLPIFPAGPIERYQEFAGSRKAVFDRISYQDGIKRLLIGFFKKVVIVNFLLNNVMRRDLYPHIYDGHPMASVFAMGYLFCSLIYAYVDLSAYADIAIGFGQLYGYKIIENMNFPIFRRNLSDYWANWHMSLSNWCRNNVYFPVLGTFRNTLLALYSSFAIMGLWHGISLNWLIWGAWQATGIAIFSYWSRFKKRRKFKLFNVHVEYTVGMLITMAYSSLGFAFINNSTPYTALQMLRKVVSIVI